MWDLLKIRRRHGYQAIPDVGHAAPPERFRGWPALQPGLCPPDCRRCLDACPTGALQVHPLAIDLGACLLCPDCSAACPAGAIQLGNDYRMAADRRGKLRVDGSSDAESYARSAVAARAELRRLFGRSLKLRSVSAGGCNGCEMELNASGNVNFDMGRFGIEIVASPRHADGLVVTGPVPENMAGALEDAWRSTPDPKILVAAGACAISGGVFSASPALKRDFFASHSPDLFIPGCPFHPLTLIHGLLGLLGRR